MKKLIILLTLISTSFLQKNQAQESNATKAECIKFIKQNIVYLNLLTVDDTESYNTYIEGDVIIVNTPNNTSKTTFDKISYAREVFKGYLGLNSIDKPNMEYNYLELETFGEAVEYRYFKHNVKEYGDDIRLYFSMRNYTEVERLIKAFRRLAYLNRQDRQKSKF